MRRRSPPCPSSPCAPIHQRPGRAGVTCGLSARHAAVTRCMARPTARSSQGRTSSPAQMARAAGMVMPFRTPSVAACVVATSTRSLRVSAMACSSQCDGSFSGDASPVARALPSLVAPADRRGGSWPSSHTAPIGNFGMRTQATRMMDDTGNLNGGTKPAAKNREFGWSPLTTAPSAFHLHSHGPTHLRHRSLTHHDERRILVAREADEAKRHLPRERRGTVEHHERERPAAQQHIGAPGAARRIAWTHHAKEGAIERRPVGWIEGARGIDAGDTLPPAQRRAYQRANQRRGACAERADELGEPPARNSAAQRFVEFRESGGEGIGRHRWRGDDLFKLGAKLGYLHKCLWFNCLRRQQRLHSSPGG